jgi:hypothetical protein
LAGRELRHVERAPAADADDGVVGAPAQRVGEPLGRVDRAAVDGEDLGAVVERLVEDREDVLALAGADD